jgi:hypothetical protein
MWRGAPLKNSVAKANIDLIQCFNRHLNGTARNNQTARLHKSDGVLLLSWTVRSGAHVRMMVTATAELNETRQPKQSSQDSLSTTP